MEKNCKWAVMIYMAADDAVGISEAYRFLTELQELCHLFKPKSFEDTEDKRKVRVFLQAYTNWNEKKNQDGTTNTPAGYGARRFEIDTDFTLERWVEVKFKNDEGMGSADSLAEFINWCRETADPKNTLLFLWGHGTGSSMFSRDLESSYEKIITTIRSFTMTDMTNGRPINDIKEITADDSPLFINNKAKIKAELTDRYYESKTDELIITRRQPTLFFKQNTDFTYPKTLFDIQKARNGESMLSMNAENVRKYLSTRSSLDALLEEEIRHGLNKFEGDKIDILMIMGCCMQMLEFAYEIRGKCTYFIGSEELIYFHGYNYFDSFTALVDYPDIDPETLAKRIVQEAPIKSSYTEFEKHSLAIACVDLELCNDLAEDINEFAKYVVDKKDERLWNKIKIARTKCRHFGEDAYTYSFIDLVWFFKNLQNLLKYDKTFTDLKNMISDILDKLENGYIIQPWIGNKRTPSFEHPRSFGGHGVGIYFPESKKAHDDNADLKIFFEPENKHANLFTTSKDSWVKMLKEYRENHGEESSYPLTDNPVPEDKEKKELKENMNSMSDIWIDELLENEKMKIGPIADDLLDESENKSHIPDYYEFIANQLLEIEKMKTGPIAEQLLKEYKTNNSISK